MQRMNNNFAFIAAYYADLLAELLSLNKQMLQELAQYKAIEEYETKINDIESRSNKCPGFSLAGRKEKTKHAE